MSRETWNEICDYVNEKGYELKEVGNNTFTCDEDAAHDLYERYPFADWDIETFDLANEVPPFDVRVVNTYDFDNGAGEPMAAAIGWDDFEQAEKFANKWGLKVEKFCKLNKGEWRRLNEDAYGPFRIPASFYGNEFEELTGKDRKDYFEKHVHPLLDGVYSLKDMRNLLEAAEEVYDRLGRIGEDEKVITRFGEYYRTLKNECMQWVNEIYTTYAIGVIER